MITRVLIFEDNPDFAESLGELISQSPGTGVGGYLPQLPACGEDGAVASPGCGADGY
jgi:hypothetical protein